MKEIVLKIGYGGIGDHLFYSPIPRIAKQKHGYDKVFISNYSPFRNPDTKKIVWEYNPFVDGFVDKDAPIPTFSTVDIGKNILDAIVDFVGLPDDGERFREPEIYYVPKIIDTLKESIIYDPNYINHVFHPSSYSISKYFLDNNIKIDYQMEKMFNASCIDGVKQLKSYNLEHFIDIIFSCRDFFSISGSSVLSAAIGKPTTVFYGNGMKSMFLHSAKHKYIKL